MANLSSMIRSHIKVEVPARVTDCQYLLHVLRGSIKIKVRSQFESLATFSVHVVYLSSYYTINTAILC